jgi:hypothetical protein
VRRRQEQTTVPGADPGPFVLDVWLERLPERYDHCPEWRTRAEHERDRNNHAYMLYLGARREARTLGRSSR